MAGPHSAGYWPKLRRWSSHAGARQPSQAQADAGEQTSSAGLQVGLRLPNGPRMVRIGPRLGRAGLASQEGQAKQRQAKSGKEDFAKCFKVGLLPCSRSSLPGPRLWPPKQTIPVKPSHWSCRLRPAGRRMWWHASSVTTCRARSDSSSWSKTSAARGAPPAWHVSLPPSPTVTPWAWATWAPNRPRPRSIPISNMIQRQALRRLGSPISRRRRSSPKRTIRPRTSRSSSTYLKANQDKLSYGHAGVGSISHVSGTLFNSQFGLKPALVAYRGTAPALNDLVGGQIDYMVDQSLNVIPQIKGGTIKVYAIAAAQRLESLPDVPTTKEAGVDFIFSAWNAMVAPKGTPRTSSTS